MRADDAGGLLIDSCNSEAICQAIRVGWAKLATATARLRTATKQQQIAQPQSRELH